MNALRTATIAALLAMSPLVADAEATPVARLTGIHGSVLVSNDFNIASAGEALRLVPGMRVLVTDNSSATVVYQNGCRVKLASGERLEIRADTPCAARAGAADAALVRALPARS